MKLLEIFAYQLAPTLRIRPRWRTLWNQRDKKAFRTNSYVFFSFFAAAYVLHYFLIDLPLRKSPLALWAQYRFGLAGLAAAGLVFTRYYYQRSNYFRLPYVVVGLAFAYMQGESMIWRREVPYGYSIILPAIAAIGLRTSLTKTVLYMLVAFLIQRTAWLSRQDELPYITSAAIVATILVAVFRSRMTADVDSFIAEQERLETQQQLIEAHKDISEQIRAFLPKEIYRRVEDLVRAGRKTVLQAMDEVLRPRQTLVTVLYSDIRGFTRLTKSVDGFATRSALPNMKACTEVVESHRGIPRPIGDLIFAYFDGAIPSHSFHDALRAAIALTQRNEQLNMAVAHERRIRRYVLLSFGVAVAGNVGGTESAREITVFGTPANILSRIDPVTKVDAVQKHLEFPAIILSSTAQRLTSMLFQGLTFTSVNLADLGIVIRDFPEENTLHILPLTSSNLSILSQVPQAGYELDYSKVLSQEELTRIAA